MADITIPAGQAGSFNFQTLDGNGVARSVTGSIVVSDYTKIYVVSRGNPANPQYAIGVKSLPAPGATWSGTVTITGTATDGSTLSKTLSVDVQGPPPPPPATQILAQSGPTLGSAPADPGSGTITFTT